MASHAITALLALTTGLLFPDNIFDYISAVFNQNHPLEQAPAPAGMISATKTIKLAADTAAPRLDLDSPYGEEAASHSPLGLLLFMSALVLSLLSFAYIHRLAQDAAASFLVESWRSALQAAAAEISDLKELLKSRADHLKACEDHITDLTKELSRLAITVTNLDSAKDLQTLLCIQKHDMVTARDDLIDAFKERLKARENQISDHVESIHMLHERLRSCVDENTALKNHMIVLEQHREACEKILADIKASSRPSDSSAGDDTPPEHSTTTTDAESEISQPRSSLSAETPPFIPSAAASTAALTNDAPEGADENDDDASAGEDDAENAQPGTGEGKKKQRRRKRGKRKSAKTLIQPPPNAPTGPRAMTDL